jgi:hypothetical protein
MALAMAEESDDQCQVVLFTDGCGQWDLQSLLLRYRRQKTPIYVWHPPLRSNEWQLSSLKIPARVSQGRALDFTLHYKANFSGNLQLTITANDKPYVNRELAVLNSEKGLSKISAPPLPPGDYFFHAFASGDSRRENNFGYAATIVEKSSPVLLVSEMEQTSLQRALQMQNIEVHRQNSIPDQLDYSAIITSPQGMSTKEPKFWDEYLQKGGGVLLTGKAVSPQESYAWVPGTFVPAPPADDKKKPTEKKDKPKVENGIRYVRERFFKGGDFHGLSDLRLQARQWCLETAGQRVHGTTHRLPLVVFREEEQAQLLPWDGEPYDVPDWRDVTVHPDHHIAYRYAIYSAPDSSCPPGTKLEVRGDAKLVRLYKRGMLVKVHPRKPRGGRSTDPDDYPSELTPYTLRSPNHYRRRSAELGEAVGSFADRLLGGPTPWSRIRQAQKLLHLGERYTPSRLNTACQRALAVDLIDVRRLERILVEALEQEAAPAAITVEAPPGRFARSGNVFAAGNNLRDNQHDNQNKGGIDDCYNGTQAAT